MTKKERQREADRRYRMRHPDRLRERALKWRKNNPEKRKAQKRRNYARHRAEILEKKRIYYATVYPWGKRREIFAVDADAYAKYRAAQRVRRARRVVLLGKAYRPRFQCRLPNWATFGQRVLDAASPFLDVNITPSQRAYARELAIERRKA